MNNIRKKRLPGNFIFSLYLLQSLGFEPTLLYTEFLPNYNGDANHYATEYL